MIQTNATIIFMLEPENARIRTNVQPLLSLFAEAQPIFSTILTIYHTILTTGLVIEKMRSSRYSHKRRLGAEFGGGAEKLFEDKNFQMKIFRKNSHFTAKI